MRVRGIGSCCAGGNRPTHRSCCNAIFDRVSAAACLLRRFASSSARFTRRMESITSEERSMASASARSASAFASSSARFAA